MPACLWGSLLTTCHLEQPNFHILTYLQGSLRHKTARSLSLQTCQSLWTPQNLHNLSWLTYHQLPYQQPCKKDLKMPLHKINIKESKQPVQFAYFFPKNDTEDQCHWIFLFVHTWHVLSLTKQSIVKASCHISTCAAFHCWCAKSINYAHDTSYHKPSVSSVYQSHTIIKFTHTLTQVSKEVPGSWVYQHGWSTFWHMAKTGKGAAVRLNSILNMAQQ